MSCASVIIDSFRFPGGISFDEFRRPFVRIASWRRGSIAESGDENVFARETISGHIDEMLVMCKKHDLSVAG